MPAPQSQSPKRIEPEDLWPDEWVDWFHLSPQERWDESAKLRQTFLSLGAILIPNPIRKVLSTIQSHQVQVLLMGGQACVLYGAAEFSRDAGRYYVADAGRRVFRNSVGTAYHV